MSKNKILLGVLLVVTAFLMVGCGSATRAPAVVVSTTSLGNGDVGVPYSQTLQASGGSGTYTWSISGGSLPGGLTLNAGVISGTPITSGTFSFTVRATDNAGATAIANLSINIQRVVPIVTTSTLPSGKIGLAYSQTLAATDGIAPYTWSISGGSLPAGLTLNAGVISGTPNIAGTFSFTIRVTDSVGSTATANLSINIVAPLSITTSALPSGELTVVYSQTLVASGGTSPYTWSISAGSLPAGLTLNAGVISGTPTTTGTFSFTMRATDSTGTTATANLTISIVVAPTITTPALPSGEVSAAYSQTLAASGGTPPYTWWISAGSLPAGLTLNAGVISGTPNTAGTFSFTVQLTDNAKVTAIANLTISIVAAPTITTSALPSGKVGTAYSQTLASSGGTPPYTWGIAAGSLPAGLTLNAGVISGIPNTAGTFSFIVQLIDSAGVAATANATIFISGT